MKLLVMIIALFLLSRMPVMAAVASSNPTLTIDNYVQTALRQGDQSRTAYNTFKSATNSLSFSYRESRLPSASVGSTLRKTKQEYGPLETTTESSEGNVTLTQPVYVTGAELTATAAETTLKTETDTSLTHSETKPAYAASIRQPLFLFVGNNAWRSWKRSKIALEISEDSYKRELQAIRNEARRLYFNVLLKREQLDVETQKVKVSQQSHLITKAMVKAGRLAGVELSRSDIRLQRDQRRLQNAETLYQQAMNEALNFAALNINVNYQFISELKYTPLLISLQRLQETAYIYRPDYKAAERQLILSELDIKDTKESDNARFTLNGTVAKSNDELDIESKSWTGSINLDWPFFDWRRTHLNVLSSINSLENQRIEFVGLKRRIEKDINNAYLEVKRAELQIDDLNRAREEARKTVDVVRTRYKNGIDKLVDVFNSETDLRDIELEYLDALISANQAKDNLSLQIGIFVEDLAP